MRIAAVLALVAAAVTIGVVPATAQVARTQATVTVTAKEFKFTIPATVKAGKVTFKLVNKGKLPHDFKIAGKKTPVIGAGKTATITVTLKKGKKYPYLCTVPGHAAAGMKGTLTAT
jgi:uncharacterized cupredoxin-like copper-binding protein